MGKMGVMRVFVPMLLVFFVCVVQAFRIDDHQVGQAPQPAATAQSPSLPSQPMDPPIAAPQPLAHSDSSHPAPSPESAKPVPPGTQFGLSSGLAMGAMGAPTPQYKAIDFLGGEDIFKVLTSYVWTDWEPNHQPSPFCGVGEGECLHKYHANGVYERGLANALSKGGRWNLQPGPHKRWLICFDNGERHLVKVFENNIIQLDDNAFKYPKQRSQ